MRLYPRASLKRILKAHLPTGTRLSGQTDVLVYLAYLAHLERLANEARLRMQLDVTAGIASARFRMEKRHVLAAANRVSLAGVGGGPQPRRRADAVATVRRSLG